MSRYIAHTTGTMEIPAFANIRSVGVVGESESKPGMYFLAVIWGPQRKEVVYFPSQDEASNARFCYVSQMKEQP